MNTRWIVAGVAAVALALVTIPFITGSPAVDTSATGTSGASNPVKGATPPCDPKGKQASLDFTVKEMNGADVKLADYKGKVILLNFWATWCGPCKEEIPGFVELQAKYKDRGLAILGLSVDDTVDKLKPYVEQFKMNYPVLLGRGRDDIETAFGPIWGLPTTVVIARDGKICQRHTGMAPKERFEKEVLALF